MTQLSQEHAVQLFQTLTAGGVDCTSLKASNPFLPEFAKTPRGREIRMVVEGLNPQLAVDLKREAGHADAQQSLAMVAALASNADPQSFTGALQEEWEAANPAVAIEATSQAVADQLASWEQQAQALEYKRTLRESGGNEAEAKRRMAATQQAEQQRQAKLEADRQHADEMHRRIQQRHREIDRAARIALRHTIIN